VRAGSKVGRRIPHLVSVLPPHHYSLRALLPLTSPGGLAVDLPERRERIHRCRNGCPGPTLPLSPSLISSLLPLPLCPPGSRTQNCRLCFPPIQAARRTSTTFVGSRRGKSNFRPIRRSKGKFEKDRHQNSEPASLCPLARRPARTRTLSLPSHRSLTSRRSSPGSAAAFLFISFPVSLLTFSRPSTFSPTSTHSTWTQRRQRQSLRS
jgi:hypothetical protein